MGTQRAHQSISRAMLLTCLDANKSNSIGQDEIKKKMFHTYNSCGDVSHLLMNRVPVLGFIVPSNVGEDVNEPRVAVAVSNSMAVAVALGDVSATYCGMNFFFVSVNTELFHFEKGMVKEFCILLPHLGETGIGSVFSLLTSEWNELRLDGTTGRKTLQYPQLCFLVT